jgi:hypothetical protein
MPPRPRRLLVRTAALAFVVALALPSAALAMNNGRGFYGETSDKVVTWAGFIIIGFFPVFIFLASKLQGYLERRKEARLKAEKSQLSSAYLRGGW